MSVRSSHQSEQPSDKFAKLDEVFKTSAKLDEMINADGTLDTRSKTNIRKLANRLGDMIDEVMDFKDENPDAIEGAREVVVNAHAKLDGQEVAFKSDMAAHYEQAA